MKQVDLSECVCVYENICTKAELLAFKIIFLIYF